MALPIYGTIPYGWGTYGWATANKPKGLPIIKSWDKWYLKGMIHKVAVEYNTTAYKDTLYGEDVIDEEWKPVPGLENVPCRLIIRRPRNELIGRPRNELIGDRPSGQIQWRVLFGHSIILDRRNRLVYADPEQQRWRPHETYKRYGYIQGRVVNAHQQDHHWVADAVEIPI